MEVFLVNPRYALALGLSALLAAAVAYVCWRRREAPGASGLAALMAAAAFWAASYALRWISASPGAQYFWLDATYLGVLATPTAALIFALEFTGRFTAIPPRLFVALGVEPLLTLLAILTDRFHGLFFGGRRSPGFILDGGPLFWFNAIYSYGLILVAALLVARHIFRVSPFYRRQVALMLVGMLLPWVGNFLSLFEFRPFPDLDLTPLIFILSGLFLGFGLFRLRLLDIVPIARGRLVEGMRDGLVVLDGRLRIIDLNPAALRIFALREQSLGESSESIFSPWPTLVEACRSTGEVQLELGIEAEGRRYYEARVSPLFDLRRRPTGKLILLHDVTRRRRAEDALQATTDELEKFFTLTPDLLTIANTEGYFLRTSPSWEELLGFKAEELKAAKFLDFVHPEDVEATLAIMEKLQNQQRIENFINRYRCKDGSYRWIEWHSQPAGQLIYAAARDITQRKQMEDELRFQSSHDALTGLYNRQYYEAELERLERSRAYPVSILVMDINGLKRINDSFGHSAGDELIRLSAQAIKASFRPEDMVARIGGDEFVVILPSTEVAAAGKAVARVRRSLEARNRELPPERRISLSIGAAAADQKPLIEIFKEADGAMYREKAAMKGEGL